MGRFLSVSLVFTVVLGVFSTSCHRSSDSEEDNVNAPSDFCLKNQSLASTARSEAILSTSVYAMVNGLTTSNYPEVGLISMILGGGKGATCSGTFLSDTTLLTAAHCQAPTIKFGSVAATSQITSSDVDLMIVLFPPGTFPGVPASLITRAPKAGDILTLVGYGQTDFLNDNPPDYRKRLGCNRITNFKGNGTQIHYVSNASTAGDQPGQQSMTGRGDSGGPLFIDKALAGVVSKGALRSDTLLHEYDTNLFSKEAVSFFSRAVSSGAKIPSFQPYKDAFSASPGVTYLITGHMNLPKSL